MASITVALGRSATSTDPIPSLICNLYKKTRSKNISQEIDTPIKMSLSCTQDVPGKDTQSSFAVDTTCECKQGRPRKTWRRTVATKLEEMGLSWGVAQFTGQDRPRWKELVAALCLTWDKEN